MRKPAERVNLKLLKNLLDVTADRGVESDRPEHRHPDEAQGIPAEAEAFRDRCVERMRSSSPVPNTTGP